MQTSLLLLVSAGSCVATGLFGANATDSCTCHASACPGNTHGWPVGQCYSGWCENSPNECSMCHGMWCGAVPSPTPPAPSPHKVCTADGEDPWLTGHKLECCDGLNQVLKPWDADGRNYYKCVAEFEEPLGANATDSCTCHASACPGNTHGWPVGQCYSGWCENSPSECSMCHGMWCGAVPSPSPTPPAPAPTPPAPAPTPPAPAPTPAPVCTAAGVDPWMTGDEVACCDGLNQVQKPWDGDGRFYYKCVAEFEEPVAIFSV